MARINVDPQLVAELADLALTAGAQIPALVALFQRHGVDPAVYKRVVEDRRTFNDFHAGNPQRTGPVITNPTPGQPATPAIPAPEPKPVEPGQSATTPLPYRQKLHVNPLTVADHLGFKPGDGVFEAKNPPEGEQTYWIVYEPEWLKVGFYKGDGQEQIGVIPG
jgi:hypothetical protein